MAESSAAWGIDIGQSALKALKLRYFEEADQMVAVAFDYVPFPKILSQPDAIAEEIIPQAMETFLSRNETAGDLIAISVPGQSALARFIQLPPVESGKLSEIIKYEARQQIPFALEEVIWDYQPMGSGAEESGYLLDAEVGLFAMKREQVMQHLKPFTDQKLEVELIQIAPLALYNVLSYDELGIRPDQEAIVGDEHTIMLDMGCDNTMLMVSNGEKIWIRNVPLGGNHFTRALTKEMKLSFAKAEHLKCNATKSPDPRAVFQALRPVFNDYVAEIQRSIGYFSSVNRQAKVTKVIGVGNGFKLAGLQKFLQQNLQYEVERPDSFEGLAGDAVLNAPLFADNVLSFTVAYGLALQAVGKTRMRTSLLPPEIATARMVRRKKPWAVAAAASLLFGYAISSMGNAISFAKPHSEEFTAAETAANELKSKVQQQQQAYDSEVGRFAQIEGRLQTIVDGRRDLTWLELYDAVVDCLPQDVGDELDEKDVTRKNMISLTDFTAEKYADVGEWFNELDPTQQLPTMLEKDRETPPTGEGYVITVHGMHWHNPEGGTSLEKGQRYLENTFLKNLQSWTVDPPDGPERDVRRMGITHPVLIEKETVPMEYDPITGTRPIRGPSRGRFGGPLEGPLAPPPRSGQPGSDEEPQVIDEFQFEVQFVYQPIAVGDRVDAPEPDAGADGATDAAAETAETTENVE